MQQLLDIFLHLDKHLTEVVNDHGPWVYGLLFAIIFVETGLVIMPFLPGDSLLFAAGALAGTGTLSLPLVLILLFIAAVIGDALNYAMGKLIGPRVFCKECAPGEKPSLYERLLNRKHLARTHAFFEKYGGKAVVIGRFVPIVRTFVPFVAGAGAMTYGRFAMYNVVGAVLWVGGCTMAGYLFGNIPVIKENFSLVVLGIVIASVIPIAVEFFLARRKASKPVGENAPPVGQ